MQKLPKLILVFYAFFFNLRILESLIIFLVIVSIHDLGGVLLRYTIFILIFRIYIAIRSSNQMDFNSKDRFFFRFLSFTLTSIIFVIFLIFLHFFKSLKIFKIPKT